MNLERSNRDWDHLGSRDPMWAILTNPERKGNRWDAGEFFATGAREVDAALERARGLRPALGSVRALDFGCGIGRLTQALARSFDSVVGVDAAPSMIAQARVQAEARGTAGCTFVLNQDDDLAQFGSEEFDFVYSRLVLQHIPSPASERLLAELVRVLRPGGVALLQAPSHPLPRPDGWKSKLPQPVVAAWHAVKRRTTLEGRIGMHGIPAERVAELVASAGGVVIEQVPDTSAPNWAGWSYAITR